MEMPGITEEAIGTLSSSNCAQDQIFCFCLDTGECFQSSGDNAVGVYPWQGKPYLYLPNPDDVFTGDQGTVLNGLDFYDEDANLKPVTEENRVLSTVACGSCPAPTSCNS